MIPTIAAVPDFGHAGKASVPGTLLAALRQIHVQRLAAARPITRVFATLFAILALPAGTPVLGAAALSAQQGRPSFFMDSDTNAVFDDDRRPIDRIHHHRSGNSIMGSAFRPTH